MNQFTRLVAGLSLGFATLWLNAEFVTPNVAAVYKKAPWLQIGRNGDSMHVFWQTQAVPGQAEIAWGSTSACLDGTMVKSPEAGNLFTHAFSNVVPGALTYFKVTVDGEIVTGSFRAPLPPTAQDIDLIAYGDSQVNGANYNQMMTTLLGYVKNELASSTPAMILDSGDLTNSGESEAEWDKTFFNITYPNIFDVYSRIPVVPSRGNHEGAGTVFKKYFRENLPTPSGQFYRSLNNGPAHVVVLDGNTSCASGSAQYNWLVQDLKDHASYPWKIVMFHQPMFAAGTHADNTSWGHLEQVFKDNGVKIVLSGHNHNYVRAERDSGVAFFTHGIAGSGFYSVSTTGKPWIKKAIANTLGFVYLRIRGNTCEVRAIAASGTGAGQIMDEAVYTVTPASDIRITAQPQNVTVIAPATATFNVTATGTEPLRYQWKKDGIDIGGATTASYTTPPTGASDHGAKFTVVISNTTGSATSQPATLSVEVDTAPTIATQPADTTVQVGKSATFRVVANGNPAPTYQWMVNGTPITGATSASYTTPATTMADNGAKYSVIVTNRVSSTPSREAVLTVTDVPPPSSDVNLALKKSTSASSTYSGRPSSLAVDGVNTTRWSSKTLTATTKTQWLEVDLGTPQSVSRAKILWGATYFASAWSVQYLDSSNVWTTVWSTTNATAGRWQEVTFPAVTASRWRVHMTANRLSNYTIYEAQLFEK